MYKRGLKRGLDFVIVFIVLLVIWPILLLLIIFLHFTNKGAGLFHPGSPWKKCSDIQSHKV